MDENIKRSILLDHYQNPRNKRTIDDKRYFSIHNSSASCVDDITVFVLIENSIIKDVAYDGKGCTICISSCSIISELIKNKTVGEGINIINNYLSMINEGQFDVDLLEEANAFDSLYKQPNRIKCGTIGVNAMLNILKEYHEKQ